MVLWPFTVLKIRRHKRAHSVENGVDLGQGELVGIQGQTFKLLTVYILSGKKKLLKSFEYVNFALS